MTARRHAETRSTLEHQGPHRVTLHGHPDGSREMTVTSVPASAGSPQFVIVDASEPDRAVRVCVDLTTAKELVHWLLTAVGAAQPKQGELL